MKTILNFLTLLLLSLSLSAQVPAGVERTSGQKQGAANTGHLYGKLVDDAGKVIGDASVLILQSRFDSATQKTKDVLLKGVTSAANGDFSFEDLPVRGALQLKISTTGFKAYEQKLSFLPSAAVRSPAGDAGVKKTPAAGGAEKDLGKIVLQPDPQQLQDVVVTAASGRMKMDIDKKVFMVDKNIVSTGGTAVDVLKNVPSLNVDIDGNVSMRNATPQIFVDGRPTILTLDQIPSDAIESVEVMTNPSAKYDASGGGAGILNIVLKKNRKTGYNGNLRAGIDKLGGVNSGFDFSYRESKINVFGSINYNQRKTNSLGIVERTNLLDIPVTTISQAISDKSAGRMLFARAGLDYFMTNRTTLSITGSKASGNFSPYQSLDIMTDSLFDGGIASSYRNRITNGTREFNNQGLIIGFKTLFPKAGEEWTADANYSSGSNSINSLYTTRYYTGQENSFTGAGLQKILGSGTDYNLVLQTDYVNPISDRTKLETGIRAAIRGRETSNSNYLFDNSANTYKLIPSTSSNYKSTDNVVAAYASITSAIGSFGYKLGLRAESSAYTGELTQTKQAFSNKYPVSLFPSVFLSQKLGGNQEIQASFTRRINRPNFFQLNPFVDYTDELNITQGNPALKPEFTNSMEMVYSKNFSKNNTVMASLYYKKTNDLITSYLQPGTNPFTGQPAIINSYVNANSSQTYGAELTSQNYITKWWDMTANLNLYNGRINQADQAVVSSGMWSWFGKWNNNFKLPANFTVQLSGTYQSKTQLLASGAQSQGGMQGGGGGSGFGIVQSAAQGYIAPFYSVDAAIRKSFLKNNAASVILSASDIFRTRNVMQVSQSAYFIQDYSRLRDPQMVRLTFTYRFGKMDASLFKRKNTNTESDAGQSQGM